MVSNSNMRRDGVSINVPGYTINQPGNGQGGSAVIKGTTFYPKPTARDSGIKTIGDSHGIETIVVEGKTLALPTQTVQAGFKGKLPGAVIGDKTITFPVVTASAKAKRDGIDINVPGYTIKDGSAVISGSTYFPKPTARDSGIKTIGDSHGIETIVVEGKTLALPTQTVQAGFKGKLPGAVIGDKTITFPVVTATAASKRDGINIGLPNYTVKDGSAVISGTTFYPKATARDGINIGLPNYTIKDGSAVISGTTYNYPKPTARSPDGININAPGYTIKEPANGKGGSAVIKGTTYYQARATPAPARRQETPTTTWANGIETIIYEGQTIALPNVTITGTNTPTSLPAATIGDQTFTFPTVTADPNAPAPTLSLSSVSGIPLPPSVTAYTPISNAATTPAPVVDGSISLSSVSGIPLPPTQATIPGAKRAVTTISLSSVSGIPLPPKSATLPGLEDRKVKTISLSSVSGIPLPPKSATIPGLEDRKVKTISLSSVSGIPLPPTTASIPGITARGFVDDMSANTMDADAWKHIAQGNTEHAGMFACGAILGIMVTSVVAVLAVFVAMRNKNRARLHDSAEYQQFIASRGEPKWKDEA